MADAFAFRFEGTEYRLERLMLSEARAIQKATGKTLVQFDEALTQGDAECVTALIWVMRKRQEPTLRFEDVDGDLMSFQPLNDEPARAEGNGQAPEGLLEMEQIALANPSTPRAAL